MVRIKEAGFGGTTWDLAGFEGGLERGLNEDPRPGAQKKLDGRAEAHLIALACSDGPEDSDHWALRAIAGELVDLGLVDSISHETVRQYLKKMN